MSLIQKIIDHLYLFFLRIRGARTFSLHTVGEVKLAELNVISFHGYEITIHCKCAQYRYIYQDRISPDKTYFVYSAHGECSEDAPDILKNAIKPKIYFPRLASTYLSTEAHNRILMEAYFDILIKRMKDSDVFSQ